MCDSKENGSRKEDKVHFVSKAKKEIIISPKAAPMESLNNRVLGDSIPFADSEISTTVLKNEVVMKKINNQNGTHKKPGLSLTHLPKRPPIEISFENLSFTVIGSGPKGNKQILKNVQGKLKSGELTAIMGPSGAGKSTLMNVLAGYKTSNLSGGSILVNGKQRNLRRFRKMSCYIMQDDCILPHLTVFESMMVSANLKLGKDINPEEKRILVEEIIESLGLSEATYTKTQCLSGGQRKRLSIALELVNNPPVMFFDEPTSGLDSSSCFQCLNLLKSLSRGGRTIICTIHQPSARLFEMFDNLYILTEGQCIYQGKVTGLVPFLGSMSLSCPSFHNPADYVMEVASGEHGECVHKLVAAVNDGKCIDFQGQQDSEMQASSSDSETNKQQNHLSPCVEERRTAEVTSGSAELKNSSGASTVVNMPITCTTSLLNSDESIEYKIGFPTNCWTQFWILLKRTFISQMRDMSLTRIRLISHIVVGFLIGTIYYDIGNDANEVLSNAGCVFFTVMFIMFTGLMPAILTFPSEMAVFVREHLNYWYSLKAYYLARTLADIPFQIVYSTAYVTIVYFMSSQPLEAYRFIMYLNVCILTSMVAQSIGLLIGSAMSVENGVFIGPVASVPSILFAGFFISFSALPRFLSFLTYISYLRYGFEGAMISVYGFGRERLKCNEVYCHYRRPDKFLQQMSMDKANYWHDVGALYLFLALTRIGTYCVLRFKLRMLR